MAKPLAPVCFAIALVCDALALMFWLRGESAGGMNCHLPAVPFAIAGFYLAGKETHRKQVWTILALGFGFAMAAPLLGVLALAAFARILNRKPAEDPAAKYVFGESQALTEIAFEPEAGATPLSVLQILSASGGEVRRNAILSLRNVEPRRAIPVLRKAIQDSDEQVRLLAQTQFNRIVGSLELAIKKMESDLARGPRTAPLLQRLAEQYHELVHLGISSAETESIYLERASELLTDLLATRPAQTDARFLLLKCQVKRQRADEAANTIAALLSQNFPGHLLDPWQAEVHFQRKDWPAVAGVIDAMRARPQTDPRLKGIVELWSPA